MQATAKKILNLADKAFKEKVKKEKSLINDKFLRDKKVLETILEFVTQRLVYKDVGDRFKTNMVVVTEEILLADYANEPENSWNRGITKIEGEKDNLKIIVNGHNYFHLAGLIARYKRDIEKSLELNYYEREKLDEKRETIDHLITLEPEIKKIMTEYQERLDNLTN